MKKILGLMGLILLIVACDDGQPSDGTSSSGSAGTGGGYVSYVCRVGEACVSTQMNCHYEPTDPTTGVLTCDGTKFVSTCEEGYFCSDDGSTPDYYPDCVSKFKETFKCDLTKHVLKPADSGMGGAGGGSSSSTTGGGGSGGAP